MTVDVRLQRVYDRRPVTGAAVLVDRVWPRGVKKDELGGTRWMRDVGPSDELRKWFGHRAERWEEFRRRYRAELGGVERRGLVDELAGMAARGPLTLLFGAGDLEHNQAVVIKEVLEERARRSRPSKRTSKKADERRLSPPQTGLQSFSS